VKEKNSSNIRLIRRVFLLLPDNAEKEGESPIWTSVGGNMGLAC
jgi:hypothetical protein